MKRNLAVLAVLSLVLLWAVLPAPAAADSSHARIVRLSLVQGDVRFARDFHKDSLTDAKASWEIAPLNLPIRQGFALATDSNGRAAVEFENGAMAFLSANTAIEFYDLSLNDGALVTRLVLRQGSAIFYVHPENADYFSVTGGDFSVEANGRSRFRLDNFDDGSNVSVEQGRVNVLRGSQTQSLDKGQSYSINVNDGSAPAIGRTGDADDFDKWVSGRIDSVATATAYSNQYVNSPGYSAGFADLFTYGSWFNVGGYGYGWRPFGMGFGWCPFDYGSWGYDPFFGWNFIGSAPWGWLPYHYGGWVFSPVYGWVWIPSGFGGYGYPVPYRPVTAVWVHARGTTGLVPLHPADNGRTPRNLNHGIYPVQGSAIATTPLVSSGEKWSVIKHPSNNVIAARTFESVAAPTRVSRTILTGSTGSRAVTLSRESSITYDPGQHRFVNNNGPAKSSSAAAKTDVGTSASTTGRNAASNAPASGTVRGTNVPSAPPRASVPPRPNVAPPQPHTTSGGSRSSGGATWSGSHSSGSSASHSSGGSSSGSSHGSSSGSSAGSASHGSSSHH
jgi:hypothetical protein